MINLTTGAGLTGAVSAVGYAIKMAWDARQERKAKALAPSGAVTDAATTSTILLSALKDEREETARLSDEVESLRKENRELYQQLQAERREYEKEIQQLKSELMDMTNRLDELHTRVKYGKLEKHE